MTNQLQDISEKHWQRQFLNKKLPSTNKSCYTNVLITSGKTFSTFLKRARLSKRFLAINAANK